MAGSISFDKNALRRIADQAVADIAAQQTSDLDRLRRQHAGKPVSIIKPALQRLFAGYGGSITDPELSEWAQMISDNTRITFAPKR